MTEVASQIDRWVTDNREECIKFFQELIAIPSPSHREEEISEFLNSRMTDIGYTVIVDEKNDVMGTIKGSGGGRSFLLNGHIDHVPVGGMVDPFSGRVMDGEELGDHGLVVYGRGACDMKGAVAAMVMAGKMLNELGVRLRGDYMVAGVALEEVGGMGTMSTIADNQFLADVVLIGEATDMRLALGHRGSMKFKVVVHGRACHASAPERGVNALYKAMKLIKRVKELAPSLPVHPVYGRASVTVTQIGVSPEAFNVVPEECVFWMDCRNHPQFTANHLYELINKVIKEIKRDDPEFKATVIPTPLINERTFSGFFTDPEKFPVVEEAMEAISTVYRKPETGIWTFATDGRIYAHLGIPVIGFGPGEERYAHTQKDHIRVQDYLDTIKVYAALACKICEVE